MKKILYVVDTYLYHYHSVRDILMNFLEDRRFIKHKQVVVHVSGYSYSRIKQEEQEGYSFYSAHHNKFKTLLKGKGFFKNFFTIMKQFYYYVLMKLGINRNNELANRKFIKKIIQKEKPDMVFFYIFSPRSDLAKMCKKLKLPYIQVLYDTYITRPDVNFEIGFKNEMYVMENSAGYFVPRHVLNEYANIYKNNKFTSYEYPLVIDKEIVELSYKNNINILYNFMYLGQITAFRNGDKVKEILKKLNLTLHVFCIDNYKSEAEFICHPGVTGQDMYNVIVQSKFLVVFDNSVPYNNMLPSKAYSYVSFTKPIIVFGDNTESALISFLQEYPCYYYHHFGDSLDGLIEFIKNNTQESAFNLEIYSKYSFATKEVAIAPIYDSIKKCLQ